MNSKSDLDYDVIVAGAGPAGLSVAAELAKKNWRVLVIEKRIAGETKRSWFVPPFVLDDETREFTFGGVTRFLAATHSGAKTEWDAKLFPAYPYIDEKRILPYWVNVIKDKGSSVMDNCSYLSRTVLPDSVSVKTSKGVFTAKLFLDATGHASKMGLSAESDLNTEIATPKQKDTNYYWWSIYGAVLEMPLTHGLRVGDYMMWQTFEDTDVNPNGSLQHGRYVFEYEVLGPNKVFALILYLRKERVAGEEMEPVFMRTILTEPTTAAFHNAKVLELKYGWYPCGGVPQAAASNRVSYVGDAGCWATPCGWGAAFILQNYKPYVEKLHIALKANKLDGKTLRNLPAFGAKEEFQLVFNRLVMLFLSNAPGPQVDKFIHFFNVIDPVLCERMFTLKLRNEDLKIAIGLFLENFTLKELASILPREDYEILHQVFLKAAGAKLKDTADKWLAKILSISPKHNKNLRYEIESDEDTFGFKKAK